MISELNLPADLKTASDETLREIAAEARSTIIDVVSARGGHLASNLGDVELTIALHKVFDTPTDQVVWDVSHQTYTHKFVTGRFDAWVAGFKKDGADVPAEYRFSKPYSEIESGAIDGFTNIYEGAFDLFNVGHTSTSVSLAAGLAKARDLTGGTQNVIAMIGDGSLSGGEALEGLNYGATLGSNFIVIVNDNEMSIPTNSGGLYSNLAALRAAGGEGPNMFKDFGYDYLYVEEGNDVSVVTEAFEKVKGCSLPTVVHIHTLKGKGYPLAEASSAGKTRYHFTGPFDKETGAGKPSGSVSFENVIEDYLRGRIENGDNIAHVIGGISIYSPALIEAFGERWIDVGIAEQTVTAVGAGLAANGVHPYLTLPATFIQRAYDQLIQDLCLNRRPATIFVPWCGAGSTDYTHHGSQDLAMLSNIPGLTYISPASIDELKSALKFAETAPTPVAIRLESPAPVAAFEVNDVWDGTSLLVRQRARESKAAIVAVGSMVQVALEAAEQTGAAVVNARHVDHVDEALLDKLVADGVTRFVTVETSIKEGGYGPKVADYVGKFGVEVHVVGAFKEMPDRLATSALNERYGLTVDNLIKLTS